MRIKSYEKNDILVEMRQDSILGFNTYVVECGSFSKAYESFYEASTIFDMFVSKGSIWH